MHHPIPWLESLLDALESEFHARNRLVSLATSDSQGMPHVRLMICRRFLPDGCIDFATDRRSEKIRHMAWNPRAELMFWLQDWREQYRLSGWLEEMGDGVRRAMWAELPEKGRSPFFWPDPGLPREPGRGFEVSVDPAVDVPENFAVIRFVPEVVEQLELSDDPYRRRRWAKASGWAVEEINP